MAVRGTNILEQHRDGSSNVHNLDVIEEKPSPTLSPSHPRGEEVPPSDDGSHSFNVNPQFEPALNLTSSPEVSPQHVIESNNVVIFYYNGHEYAGDIPILNLTRQPVIFKIKTTATDVYRVAPIFGLVAGRAQAFVHVYANSKVNNFNVRQHRFKVQAALLPHDLDDATTNEEEADEHPQVNYSRLNDLWKKMIGHRIPLQYVRLRCAVISKAEVGDGNQEILHRIAALPPPLAVHDAGANTTAMNIKGGEGDMRIRIADLEAWVVRVTTNIHDMFEEKENNRLLVFRILFALVAFFGLITLLMTSSSRQKEIYNGTSAGTAGNSENITDSNQTQSYWSYWQYIIFSVLENLLFDMVDEITE